MELASITSGPELKERVNIFDILAPDGLPTLEQRPRERFPGFDIAGLDAGGGAGVGVSAVARTAPAIVSLPGYEHQFIYNLSRAGLRGRQAGGQE